MKPKFSDAVLAIIPDAEFVCSSTEVLNWYDQRSQPSDEAINTKLAELQAEYNANKYQRDRASAYPSIQDQLDMQYHDLVDGTTTWKDAVAKVKSDNPKPE